MSEQLSCQKYHLCHYDVSYKEVNLDLIVRKLSNSEQMSARVILLLGSIKIALGNHSVGFEKFNCFSKNHNVYARVGREAGFRHL